MSPVPSLRVIGPDDFPPEPPAPEPEEEPRRRWWWARLYAWWDAGRCERGRHLVRDGGDIETCTRPGCTWIRVKIR